MRRFVSVLGLAVMMVTVHAAPSSATAQLAGAEADVPTLDSEQLAFAAPSDLYPVDVLTSGIIDNIGMELDPATGHIIGTRFVADQVVTWDLAGNELDSWGVSGNGSGQLDTPTGLAVDGDLLYVTDYGNDRIQVFTKDGDLVDSWGSPDYPVSCRQYFAVRRIAHANRSNTTSRCYHRQEEQS